MRDLQAIADRVQIEALRGKYTDPPMTRDRDRLAPPLTHDSAWRIPDGRHTGVPEEMRHRAAYKQLWPASLGEPSCPKHDR
jgi:hypothetical protein